MNKKIIIENFGKGHAIVVIEQDRIIDLYLDPPENTNFYPPKTLLTAKIDRRISSIGGYFLKLPNGLEGFLKSKRHYQEGSSINVLSKVFYDPSKPQTFTDKLKTVSKFFVIELGKHGFSFSKKLSKNFNKRQLATYIKCALNKHKDVFVILRSCISELNFIEIQTQLEMHLDHFKRNISNLDKKTNRSL